MSGKWLVELGDAINCKECRYGANCNVGEGHGYKVGECKHFEKAKKQTNADQIRNMTDEKLADWYFTATYEMPNAKCKAATSCIGKDCFDCLLEWLKQEVEE